ncbi:AAA family ATPase [Oscillibacter sp. 1-3]|uniref:AAA family ATPase n=1 Tax=Oscillibacter sp. 1-3 TaxID=1235797 RepID=UPI0009DC2312
MYIATILAEFEGLKDRYTTPRILLVEELEAQLHPQLQIKLLKYLSQQAADYDIQVIITTHSTTLGLV